ncbi:MAG: 50S ribosomal protein L4 [Acidobacteriota bacterium]
MKIAVKNLDNKTLREIELPEAVFGYPYNEHLIHEAVQAVQAAARRGTHKTKTRSEVSGSGRKLWRQKGTGRSRVGDIRNPKWRKGGIVHGPQPRSYEKKLSAREKRNALKSALSRKIAAEQITVLDSLELASHRTQELAKSLSGLGIEGKALLVDSRDNLNLERASRNNPALKAVDALAVNVYDVVGRPHLLLSEGALNRLLEVLSK